MKDATDIEIQGLDELFEKYRKSPNSYVFVLLADACRKLGRIDEALEICGRGIERHPRYASGHVVRGKCHYDLDDHDTARGAFEKVLTLDQNNLVALKYLGMIEANRGDYDSARGYFQHILRLDPDNQSIKETMRVMEEHRQMSSDTVTPRPAVGSAADDEPGVPGAGAAVETSDELATLTLADIFAAQGYHDKAVKICEELLKKNPRNGVVREKLKSLGGDPNDIPHTEPSVASVGRAEMPDAQAVEIDDPSAVDLDGGTDEPSAADPDGTDGPSAAGLDGADDPNAIDLGGRTADPGGAAAAARDRVIELGGGGLGEPVRPTLSGNAMDGRGAAPARDEADGRETVELTGPMDDRGAILLPQDSPDLEAAPPREAPAEPEAVGRARPPQAGARTTDTPVGFSEIDSGATGPQGADAPRAADERRDVEGGEPAPSQHARRAIDEKESMSHFQRWLRQMKD
ncbi:MAG: tetratricopeptide repeat protein [Candidatus Krumholzibacteriia bacterium]